MNSSMNGKEIAYAEFAGVDARGVEQILAPKGGKLIFSASFHGDREEFWILIQNRDGTEIKRANCKCVRSIEWA